MVSQGPRCGDFSYRPRFKSPKSRTPELRGWRRLNRRIPEAGETSIRRFRDFGDLNRMAAESQTHRLRCFGDIK